MGIFEASVIAIGIVGGISNLLMFLALANSKARKTEMAIVFNQMILDCVCCSQLVITYIVKILQVDYSDNSLTILCKFLESEPLLWYFLGCSTANLIVLSLERYVKIVHAVFHKRHFRRWMYFVAIALTWVNFGSVFSSVITALSAVVLSGQCVGYGKMPDGIDAKAFAIYKFLDNFSLPLVTFVFCYTRILQVTSKRIVPGTCPNIQM